MNKSIIKTSRCGEIELWRGLAACMILLLHTHYIPGVHALCKEGNIAVEFFFLLSGYLMAASMVKRAQIPCPASALPQETSAFVWHKIKAFWPELFLACGIGLCFFAVAHHAEPAKIAITCLETLGSNVLMLKMTGLTAHGINGATWYLSAMVIGCTLLYPLLRRFGTNPVLGMLGLMILGGMYAVEGEKCGFAYVFNWMGVTFKGNLRAVSELLIGATLLYPLAMHLRRRKAARWFSFLLTVVKWLCLAAVAWYGFCGSYIYAGYVFVAICLALVLCFSGLCADSKLYDNRLFLFMGRMSLPIYLSHYVYSTDLQYLLPEGCSISVKLAVYLACSFTTALMVLYGGAVLRRLPSPLTPRGPEP